MVKEVGELELGDGLPERKLQVPYHGVYSEEYGGKDALTALI